MWRRFCEFAKDTMPGFDNIRKLWGLFALFGTLGFGLGVISVNLTNMLLAQQSATFAASAATSGSNTCEVLSEVSRVQVAYGTQIEPVRARWLELTAKLERGDMLNSERENVAETEKLVQRELQRLQANHQEIVTGITQACFPK